MDACSDIVVDIRFNAETGIEPPTSGTLVVQLRDTGEMDAPSVVIASGEPTIVTDSATGVAIRDIPAAEHRRSITVWAHCDVDGSGAISRGDWITTRAHNVDLDSLQSGDRVEVQLDLVR